MNGPDSPVMSYNNGSTGSVSSRTGSISGASGRRHKHSPDLQLNIEVTKKKHARQRISESSKFSSDYLLTGW